MPARLLVIVLAALLHAHSLRAESLVAGAPDAVRLDARDATVDELLAALGTTFGLHYRSAASLDRRISGHYEGSLQRVVARLLEGYDFFVKTSAGNVEVVVLGSAKRGEIAPAPVQIRRRVD